MARSILVVDDESSVRKLVRQALALQGYAVTEAAGGEEALRLCTDSTQTIELVVTDIRMPGLNGCELAAKLAACRPDLRLLFMSGFSVPPECGIDVPVVRKPFSLESLAAAVAAAFES